MNIRISYAQNREDVILDAFFSDVETGFYVDVGANHPELDSVTKIFYDKGWTGMNIEPNRALCDLLAAARPKDINLNVGISDKPGSLIFREYTNHGLSTFSTAMQKGYEKTQGTGTDEYIEYEVKVRTLADIFKEYEVDHMHFLKVDVEGFEYEVLAGNDWKKYRPEMICIESNHIVKDWRPIFKSNGYKNVFFDGLNDYYLAKESAWRADNFSYPEQIILGPPVVHISSYDAIKKSEDDVKAIKKMYLHEKAEIGRLSDHIDYMHEELTQQKSVKSQLRSLLGSVDRAIYRRIDLLGSKGKKAHVDYINTTNPKSNTRHTLGAVRQHDFINSYNTTKQRRIAHKVIMSVYSTTRKSAINGARKLKRLSK